MKAELETWQQSVLRSYRGEDYPGPSSAGTMPHAAQFTLARSASEETTCVPRLRVGLVSTPTPSRIARQHPAPPKM